MASVPERPTVGSLVWRLSLKWRAAVDRAVAPLGLTQAQYTVVASLLGMTRGGHRPTQRELADHTGLEPIYVSKLVRALERAGLVERTPDPHDTRAVRLALTPGGREVTSRAIAVVRELLEQLTAPIGGTAGERSRDLADTLQALLAAPTPPSASPDGKREEP